MKIKKKTKCIFSLCLSIFQAARRNDVTNDAGGSREDKQFETEITAFRIVGSRARKENGIMQFRFEFCMCQRMLPQHHRPHRRARHPSIRT